ncbi:hypothetical protein V8G54_025402 [Vigna mungo]|uniref:Uncharacterized protein n=1 Tax=Vigna mungo TaxID=3915 RepID=A0AAQ3MXQ6_VIGMU
MILKDLMEEKQLNFNQPLLSVRRFSSTGANEGDRRSKTDYSLARLPPPLAYHSELKSVPVRNAGTVPFVWEKAPGKPKDETKLQTQAAEQPLGRVSEIKQQSVTEMRTGSSFFSNSQRVASFNKRVAKYSKDGNTEKESSYSDDGDESYKDALDTLSRSESFFTSCSLSGLSGWEEQEAQSYGSFSSDHRQARDFMIDRFLPAATSEAPHHVSKKELVGQEQQKQKKRQANLEESDDCNEYEKSRTTTCGLFPRFCLLNPIPGLTMDKVQRNAAHGMHAKSGASYIGSTKGQVTDKKEILDILVKSRHGTDPHQRVRRKIVSCESSQHDYESQVHEKKTTYVDSVNKVTSQTNTRGGDYETWRRDNGVYNNPSIDSSSEMIAFKEIINSESQGYSRINNSNSLNQNSEVELKSHLSAKWVDKECCMDSSKVRYDGKIALERQRFTESGDQETSGASCFGLPLVLPSLKAPSESWLKRTLPTISKNNVTSRSSFIANLHAQCHSPDNIILP